MKVKLLAHTKLSTDFLLDMTEEALESTGFASDSALVALTAIRTCYSHNPPSEIVNLEGGKYFVKDATDGEGGKEVDRLFRHIVRSGHTSTLEHIQYTFTIEGVSRALLAQLTRHRHFSFSVQSQRYVRMGSEDKSGGFAAVTPPSISENEKVGLAIDHNQPVLADAETLFEYVMETSQAVYDMLRKLGVPPEDARMVFPNAAATNLVMSANLRAILDFYRKRKSGKGAQWEIAELAEKIRKTVVNADPWTEAYFDL